MVNVLCSMSPVISEKNNRGINLLKQKWFGRVYLGFTTHHAVLESQISSGTSHVNGHWSEAAGEEAAPTSAQYIGEAKELFPSSVRSTKKKKSNVASPCGKQRKQRVWCHRPLPKRLRSLPLPKNEFDPKMVWSG